MGLPGVLWGPILGPNRGMFSKLNGPGPLGSKGYPHTSFNSGKFPDTYKSFHIGVCWMTKSRYLLKAPVRSTYIQSSYRFIQFLTGLKVLQNNKKEDVIFQAKGD